MTSEWSSMTAGQKGSSAAGMATELIGSIMGYQTAGVQEDILRLKAGRSRKYGLERMKSVLSETEQAISSFAAGQAGSGVVDFSSAAAQIGAGYRGAKAAAREKYAGDVEAIGYETQGKIGKAKGLADIGSSIMNIGGKISNMGAPI